MIYSALNYLHGLFLPGMLKSATWSVGIVAWGVISIADVGKSSFWAGAPGILRIVPMVYIGWFWGMGLTLTMVEGRFIELLIGVGTDDPGSAISPLECVSWGDALFTLSAALFRTILKNRIRISTDVFWTVPSRICGAGTSNPKDLFESWPTQNNDCLKV